MTFDYDVIVAGGGMAGTLAAAAASRKGASVLLLDRNNQEQIGKKTNWGWVCGDAVAKSHLDFVTRELGLSFSEPELDLKVDGVYVISPDMKNKFLFDGEGYVLDRPKFQRKLLDAALRFGANLRTDYSVEGPLIEDGQVVGVHGRDSEKGDSRIRSRLVVDALGVSTTLRRRLPENEFIESEVSRDDIESTGRFIYDFEPAGNDDYFYDPKNALIHLNQRMCPGGYGWVFPKRGKKVNIGIGVEKKSLELRNSKLGKQDTLQSLMNQYVDWNGVVKNCRTDNADNNGIGYWSVTVRRQLESLVYNNYLAAGDSAAMPNPVSAGGIGPALVAGVLSGEVAGESIQSHDTSMESLWKYNMRFNEEYGHKTAALEVFRVYLQSLNNDLIDYGMAHFLTKEEAIQISYGLTPKLSLSSRFRKVLAGVANITAFKNLVYTVNKMTRLNDLYQHHYPKSPKEFRAWKAKIHEEMKDAKQRFPVNPV